MNLQQSAVRIGDLLHALEAIGRPLEIVLLAAAAVLVLIVIVPSSRGWSGRALGVLTLLLLLGEGVLAWFHQQLYALTMVVSPETGQVTGNVAVPLWVESEKLYVWALIVAVMGLLMRRHRKELLPGVALIAAGLTAGAVLWGHPFTNPVPIFFEQYGGYVSAMLSGDPQAAFGAYQGMESARQFYYNAWFMWVHPPLLFFSYGAFAVSFVAVIQMVRTKYSAYEQTAYRWARLGYLPLTAGMLIGFPWAVLAWQGDAWWWSGKVNMSVMMWLLYTAYLHARLYLRRKGMWRWVAVLAILSFAILVLTYIATYIIPGAHSYA